MRKKGYFISGSEGFTPTPSFPLSGPNTQKNFFYLCLSLICLDKKNWGIGKAYYKILCKYVEVIS